MKNSHMVAEKYKINIPEIFAPVLLIIAGLVTGLNNFPWQLSLLMVAAGIFLTYKNDSRFVNIIMIFVSILSLYICRSPL